jgi:tripartite-type tricarboxylate transporter receptor subunit TctC
MHGWKIPFCASLALIALINAAVAQEYPNRPITLVVPFPPGGTSTIIARSVADKLGEALGQQIIVDNRGGAGGTIATRAVAKMPPDGYTILLGYTGTLAIGPTLYPSAGYDPRKDFAAIGLIGYAANSLVVHPSFVHSVKDVVAYAKANPGKVNYGSAGVGTVGHVAGVYLAGAAGIELTHIPYKGTGAALTDVLGGHIPMAFAPIPAARANVAEGRLHALAVTSAQRSRLLPDVPTIAESGIPGFEASLYYGLVAPAGTPRPIIDKLNKALRAALATDDVLKRLATDGTEPFPSSPEEHAAYIDLEETKWSKIVRESGARAAE